MVEEWDIQNHLKLTAISNEIQGNIVYTETTVCHDFKEVKYCAGLNNVAFGSCWEDFFVILLISLYVIALVIYLLLAIKLSKNKDLQYKDSKKEERLIFFMWFFGVLSTSWFLTERRTRKVEACLRLTFAAAVNVCC